MPSEPEIDISRRVPISAARAHGLIGAFRAPLSSGVSLRVALRVALRLALPLRARLEGALSELFLCERLEPALRARLHLGRRKLERLRRCERPRPRAWLLVEDLGLPLSLLLALPARRRLPLHVLADARDAHLGGRRRRSRQQRGAEGALLTRRLLERRARALENRLKGEIWEKWGATNGRNGWVGGEIRYLELRLPLLLLVPQTLGELVRRVRLEACAPARASSDRCGARVDFGGEGALGFELDLALASECLSKRLALRIGRHLVGRLDAREPRRDGIDPRREPENKKTEFKGEIWEEWALTYGRNGSSEKKKQKNTSTRARGSVRRGGVRARASATRSTS